ncbi:cytochrome P450 2F2-like [Pseudophryne corroboree]|uniref:cytochrome P450 2F2-like n=1 Tax=Pseudophryne corroboree TaxID=495146 RepID=UPI00308215BD
MKFRKGGGAKRHCTHSAMPASNSVGEREEQHSLYSIEQSISPPDTDRTMSVFPALTLVVSFLLPLFFLLLSWRRHKKYQFLPPGPAPLPFLGTPKYIGDVAALKYYPELCKKYGPLFTLWKGMDPVVVLCGYEVIKDALLKHAEEFSGRPYTAVTEHYSGGHGFGSSNGERWCQLRRFSVALLKNHGSHKMDIEKLVSEETQSLVQAVSQHEGKAFNSYNLMAGAAGNMIMHRLIGKRFDYEDPDLQEIIEVARDFILNFHCTLHEIANTFPILIRMPIINQKIFKASSHMKSLVQNFIDQHKQTLNPAAPRDFTDLFLMKIKEEEHMPGSHFCENNLLISLIDMIGAGFDATSFSTNFSLVLISNYPEEQRKVQQEIDDVTQSLRPPGFMDRAQMPYTNAVIHEIQRVLDLAPTAHYHAVTKDTQFRGYTLPKGTTVSPFLTSVHYDSTQWETPNEFNPGHFLDEKGQFRTRPAFMPFSAGPRICAGEAHARMTLFTLFAVLLQKFTFTPPPGTERQDLKSLTLDRDTTVLITQVCAIPRSVSA